MKMCIIRLSVCEICVDTEYMKRKRESTAALSYSFMVGEKKDEKQTLQILELLCTKLKSKHCTSRL